MADGEWLIADCVMRDMQYAIGDMQYAIRDTLSATRHLPV